MLKGPVCGSPLRSPLRRPVAPVSAATLSEFSLATSTDDPSPLLAAATRASAAAMTATATASAAADAPAVALLGRGDFDAEAGIRPASPPSGIEAALHSALDRGVGASPPPRSAGATSGGRALLASGAPLSTGKRRAATTADFQLLCVIGMGAFGRVLQVAVLPLPLLVCLRIVAWALSWCPTAGIAISTLRKGVVL